MSETTTKPTPALQVRAVVLGRQQAAEEQVRARDAEIQQEREEQRIAALGAWLADHQIDAQPSTNELPIGDGFWISVARASEGSWDRSQLQLHGPCPDCGAPLDAGAVFSDMEELGRQLSRWAWHADQNRHRCPYHPPAIVSAPSLEERLRDLLTELLDGYYQEVGG